MIGKVCSVTRSTGNAEINGRLNYEYPNRHDYGELNTVLLSPQSLDHQGQSTVRNAAPPV